MIELNKQPELWDRDPFLEPYKDIIIRRYRDRVLRSCELRGMSPSLWDIANGHLYYGVHKTEDGWICREWAPNATEMYLIGECNNWQIKPEYAFRRIGRGNWELKLRDDQLRHLQLYKWMIKWPGGEGERLPAYVRRCVQDPHTKIFSAQVWAPARPYRWRYRRPKRNNNPLIYEAHVGMSSEKAEIADFNYFRKEVLPRIVKDGYNTIQLMAVQEHPYYGSFGYQVSNFFAVSSRFGTPEELKKLIDEAHAAGLAVILDLVHSHSVKNEAEGLACLDGNPSLYFYSGERRLHPVWSSLCFDYGKTEVLHFLLSNCKYWLEEYRFDGFRFDGITSMVYLDHGIGRDFTDYSMYFDGNQDENAIIYLGLANELIHSNYPQAITVAEDMSGMPGLAYSLEKKGIGFDFRMSMGVADQWQKLLKKVPDEKWHVGDLFYQLTNKRSDEHTISYAECHDQAMVGDKTIIFSLIDKEMYSSMSLDIPSLVVDRGIALHKMIRLLSLGTAGDGYLNFMGNEFGHPEWIDFPREGNNWSCYYARRQWSLADSPFLHYSQLLAFDRAMIALAREHNIFDCPPEALTQDIAQQILAFKRGNLIFVFNFNPTQSFAGYGIPVPPGKYRCILDSDELRFGGFARNKAGLEHFSQSFIKDQTIQNQILVYLPARTCTCYIK